jgi:hypothetical protein
MKKSLVEEKSPLDACLESVLPGVHQWHHANNAAVASLREDMRSMSCGLQDGFDRIVGVLTDERKHRLDQDAQLAKLLELGRNVLLTGNGSAEISNDNRFMSPERNRASGSPESSPMTMTPMTNQISPADNDAELERHKMYAMRPKHKLLVDLMSEWVGAGDFEDEFGGIEGRNNKFGASWRKHLVSYMYSRTERTIKGIRAYAQHNRITDFDACEELQAVYEKQKYSVANMVNYFTQVGMLTKRKPRGKLNAQSVSPSGPTQQLI